MEINKKAVKILNSAINLFIQNGVRKTTMDELAEKANVSKVTIYKYFGNKENIYYETGAWIMEEYLKKLSDIAKFPTSVEASMKAVITVMSDFIVSDKLGLCFELADLNEKLSGKLEKFNHEYRQLILKLIEEGKAKRIIKSSIDSNYIFSYIDMGISYFRHNAEYREAMLTDEAFKQGYMAFMLSHIFK